MRLPDLPARPAPGDTTTRELRVKVCARCRCVVDFLGMCSYDCPLYGCPLDTKARTKDDFFTAVYERTDKFLRDEPGGAK